jgi:hypothetical protein
LQRFPSRPAAAQECGQYEECGTGHKIKYPGFTLRLNPHNDCRICPGQGGGDDWEYCHPGCGGSFVDPLRARTYLALLRAAHEGNVTGVLQLAPQMSEYVFYNADRKSIQIQSCQKDVLIANLPIPEMMVAGNVLALPRATGTYALQAAHLP